MNQSQSLSAAVVAPYLAYVAPLRAQFPCAKYTVKNRCIRASLQWWVAGSISEGQEDQSAKRIKCRTLDPAAKQAALVFKDRFPEKSVVSSAFSGD
jgi:hypothetical protein